MTEWISVKEALPKIMVEVEAKETVYPFRETNRAILLENNHWSNLNAGILLPLKISHWKSKEKKENEC